MAGRAAAGANASADFRGEKRSNATYQSTTDLDARLYRQGPGMEALWSSPSLTGGSVTPGADKSYDAADFVEDLRTLHVRPHVAQNTSRRRLAIDHRTTRHPGYRASQRCRKPIEEALGWIKAVAGLRQTKLRGRSKVAWAFTFAAAAYNLVQAPKLLAAASWPARQPVN